MSPETYPEIPAWRAAGAEAQAMGGRAQPGRQALSAGQSRRQSRRIRWAEDLVYIGNRYCPFCGARFQLDDVIVELVTDYEGELGNITIDVHERCLLKALEVEDL